jgi:hypothetical protein
MSTTFIKADIIWRRGTGTWLPPFAASASASFNPSRLSRCTTSEYSIELVVVMEPRSSRTMRDNMYVFFANFASFSFVPWSSLSSFIFIFIFIFFIFYIMSHLAIPFLFTFPSVHSTRFWPLFLFRMTMIGMRVATISRLRCIPMLFNYCTRGMRSWWWEFGAAMASRS